MTSSVQGNKEKKNIGWTYAHTIKKGNKQRKE